MRSTLTFSAVICLTFAAFASICTVTCADISGFNNGIGWQQNGAGYIFGGGGTSITGDQLTVTTVNVTGNNSAFFETPQPIQNFVAKFTYTDAANGNQGQNGGNGMAFVLQNDPRGTTVYTYGGGSTLGYGAGFNAAIAPSVAVEFNIDTNFYPTAGTAFGVNGSTGTYGPTGSIELNSGHPIDVTVSYDGTNLSESLHDTITGASYGQSISADLSYIGTQAYIGFTGGSGLDTATQLVSDFTYSAVPEPSSFVLCGLGASSSCCAVVRRRRPSRDRFVLTLALIVLANGYARADINGFNGGIGWQTNTAGSGGPATFAGQTLTITTVNFGTDNMPSSKPNSRTATLPPASPIPMPPIASAEATAPRLCFKQTRAEPVHWPLAAGARSAMVTQAIRSPIAWRSSFTSTVCLRRRSVSAWTSMVVPARTSRRAA